MMTKLNFSAEPEDHLARMRKHFSVSSVVNLSHDR
jgi:hypothetical protein